MTLTSSPIFLRRCVLSGVIACWAGIALAGCQANKEPAGKQVSEAWSATPPEAATSSPDTTARTRAPAPNSLIASTDDEGDAIAIVDGRPISRSRVVDLLMAGHGVGVLEQVVVLERAKTMAARQGIVVSPADIDAELDRSLRNLLSSIEAADETTPFDRTEARKLLDEVLARRNISQQECMAVIERNAYLRALVQANMNFTDEQLGEEYLRSFSRRVEIRHIQFAALAEAERISQLIEAGSDFAELARTYSANLRTAPSGGLLRPFSQNDADVPAAFRDAAFALDTGGISNPIRVDDWYHIIKVERKLEAETRTVEEMRPELEQRLRHRAIEPAMQTLYRDLFESADIRIVDPILDAEFQRRHPGRSSARTDALNSDAPRPDAPKPDTTVRDD